MAYNILDKNLPAILLQYLRSTADPDGYVTFNGSTFALDHGISPSTSSKLLRKLEKDGRLEYTREGKFGSLVHLIPPEADPQKPEPRKCPKCGESAHDDHARFCYRCGTSLLSEREQIKEQIGKLLPRIFREIDSSALVSELSSVMSRLMDIAFKEDEQ